MNRPRGWLFAALLIAPVCAVADRVTCESWDGDRRECHLDARGGVRIVEQRSHTDCVEGRTWGVYHDTVWVDGGCRAVFESHANRYDREEHGAGYSEAGGQTVSCESNDRRRNECPMDTRGGVRVVRQLSRTDCVEGVNWGVSRNAVWVEGGCRAVFARDAGGHSGHHRPYEDGIPPPRVDMNRQDDAATVFFRGGCEVLFAPNGQMVKSSSTCTSEEKNAAREAYEAARNEKHADFSDV